MIKERELYFSIVVVECTDKSESWPLQPYLDGRIIDGGKFPNVRAETIYGTMPVKGFGQY